MTPERIAILRCYCVPDDMGIHDDCARDLAECLNEIERLQSALADVESESGDWERTAKRYASKAGWENSDYLEPDTEDGE